MSLYKSCFVKYWMESTLCVLGVLLAMLVFHTDQCSTQNHVHVQATKHPPSYAYPLAYQPAENPY